MRCSSDDIPQDRELAQESSMLSSAPREAASVVLDVQERPALPPNVCLVGEIQGTGFTDPQWLIQRDSQFIQLSEVLYRVVEQADGRHTLDEIAAGVTQTTNWMMNADDVRLLIQTKLMPLGLVGGADGSVMSPSDHRSRSLLQVNMRRTILGPRILDLIARILQVLYAPPILIPIVLAATIAYGWLYFSHGMGRVLDAFIYAPWLVLLLLPLALTSGLFHEFGHAAALRYGGGQARGLGMGFYLIYPTFYTDTSDAYRLGRWARVRTDLGGFYFDLIFALGIIALHWVSGQELLLVVVMMISWNILYQCLPFVRLDGYWALADLTGIPDLFSQIELLLRPAVPTSDRTGTILPNLKPWVKLIFIAYTILTLPALACLGLLLVAFVPRHAITVWDSLLNQTRQLSSAQSTGDFLAMATAVAQILILVIFVLGFAYVVSRLSRGAIQTVWDWSKPTPRRRIAGALISATILAFVGWLWAPQLPYTVWAWTVPPGPPGTQTFEVAERFHVATIVSYPQTPPVGGKHAPIWQNCGFYDAPVRNETAVHSLEHGSVWLTYRPDLPREQVELLRDMARRQDHILVSPYPNLPAPVVASAWGKQLRLESAEDPRLSEFVPAFRLGRQAPEPGERCDGGVGEPA
jgi:hypothetical protein